MDIHRFLSLTDQHPPGFEKITQDCQDMMDCNFCLFSTDLDAAVAFFDSKCKTSHCIIATPGEALSYNRVASRLWHLSFPGSIEFIVKELACLLYQVPFALFCENEKLREENALLKKQNTLLEVTARSGDALQSDLKKQTRIAREMTQKAQAASESKSIFLANMSHEIRTPMNGVVGMLDMLAETKLTPEQLDYAVSAQQSAESLLLLINDILDFSKIEAGRLEVEKIDFNLEITLDSFIDAMAIKAFEKGAEFACLIEENVPLALRGDPGRLRQVLTNLAGNALKFVDKGDVFVRISETGSEERTTVLKFEVIDNGIGIPPEKLEQLFDPFTQVDASTTRKYGGTGLGLAISKQLAKLLGGEIGVESRLNKGSHFWFTAVFEKQSEQAAAIKPCDNIRQTRILVVDSRDTTHLVLGEYFKSWECPFDSARSVDQALLMLRKEAEKGTPFQMLLIDSQMPHLSGEDLGRIIKTDKHLHDTILVMLSSNAIRGDAKKIRDIGFAGFLTKPIKKEKLHDCIRTILGTAKKDLEDPCKPLITSYKAKEIQGRQSKKFPRKKILLAEDNVVNQKVANLMFKKIGQQATIAQNGEEAVALFKKQVFDIIFMDIQMPIMDGVEATKQIRLLEKNRVHTPVIALTANAMKGDKEFFLSAGMDDYMSKPIKLEQILRIMETHLGPA